jgi:hypothetical protein
VALAGADRSVKCDCSWREHQRMGSSGRGARRSSWPFPPSRARQVVRSSPGTVTHRHRSAVVVTAGEPSSYQRRRRRNGRGRLPSIGRAHDWEVRMHLKNVTKKSCIKHHINTRYGVELLLKTLPLVSHCVSDVCVALRNGQRRLRAWSVSGFTGSTCPKECATWP